VTFEDWLLEVCALSPNSLPRLFDAARRHRSAPVPKQIVEGILVVGDETTAQRVKEDARRVLREGPKPLSAEEQRSSLSYT